MIPLLRYARVTTRLCALTGMFALGLRADEGMWLFNVPPIQPVKKAYGFDLTPAWLEHVQKSSIRFNNGGSGSFISAEGLMITNHHVAEDVIQKLSTPEHNYVRDGFRASSRAEELKCTDLELNVLISMENVTSRVNAAVKAGASAADAFSTRRAVIAAIEKESLEKTGLRSDVVTLYQGAEYHLYRYKRYTDVRLVFAPEEQAAFFGGDPDNFEFPRYDLDISILRAYENGAPAKIEHYLKVQPKGAAENELVFVSGHPGSTDRSLTVAELASQRDLRAPLILNYLKINEVALGSWSGRSQENARRARDEFLYVQNSRKVYDGRIQALLDPAFFKIKQAEEADLRAFARSRPDFANAVGAWDLVARAQQALSDNYKRQFFLESRDPTRVPIPTFNSELLRIGRLLYRLPTEKLKPNGDRLREYRDSNQASLELELFSAEPIFNDFEQIKLTQFLTLLATELGFEDPIVQQILHGKTPLVRASELINGTKLGDVAFRKQLYAMNAAEIANVSDPVITFMKEIDSAARTARKVFDEQTNVKAEAHALIAKVRYAKFGASVYPDATFTLRLAYGKIAGYEDQGKHVAPFTELGGTYQRSAEHENREPFDLPVHWVNAKDRVARETPFNFVNTCDITGGNSGSPTINRAGEFVGIIFDGNIYSLIDDYGYDDVQSRAVSVDVRAIIECLRHVYGAGDLVNEILGVRANDGESFEIIFFPRGRS